MENTKSATLCTQKQWKEALIQQRRLSAVIELKLQSASGRMCGKKELAYIERRKMMTVILLYIFVKQFAMNFREESAL